MLKERIKKIYFYRHTLWDMALKQLKAKYASYLLGIIWALINPLLLALIIAFIFTEIIKVNIRHFYLFIISGMLPWLFFSNSLQEATKSVVSNASLLKQFSFPREFIPLASVLTNFFNLLLGFLIVIPLFIISNLKLIFTLPFLVLVLLLHLVFTLGITLILSSLYVRFRDIDQFLGVLLLFWLWLTPVFYTLDMVPDKYRLLFKLNPLTAYITLYRGILFDVSLFNLRLIFWAFFLAVISLCLGYAVFVKKESSFLKWI